jgi:AbrB family looped-hinge helix DNA binding protein
MQATATLDKAGRLVLPKALRDALDLAPGDILGLTMEDERVTPRPRNIAPRRPKRKFCIPGTRGTTCACPHRSPGESAGPIDDFTAQRTSSVHGRPTKRLGLPMRSSGPTIGLGSKASANDDPGCPFKRRLSVPLTRPLEIPAESVDRAGGRRPRAGRARGPAAPPATAAPGGWPIGHWA